MVEKMPSDDEGKHHSVGAEVMAKFIAKIPLHLRQGPWKITAHLYLLYFSAFLLLSAPHAFDSYKEDTFEKSSPFLFRFRLGMGLYCLCVSVLLYFRAGVYPFLTYTVTSWNLMVLRLLFSSMEQQSRVLMVVSRILRFPALAGTSVTFTLWWTILFPLVYYVSDSHRRKQFLAFNSSFLLVNIHMLNMPICATEFVLTGHHLAYFDVWIGFCVALVYMLFYLNVLDRVGAHIYIFLTPRTHFCILNYSVVLSVYLACFYGWNYVSHHVHLVA